MVAAGHQPKISTIVSLIKGLSRVGNHAEAEAWLARTEEFGLNATEEGLSALVFGHAVGMKKDFKRAQCVRCLSPSSSPDRIVV